MRLALVATPAALPDLRPAPGSLDGDVIRARLPLPDAAFRVVDLDPAVDVAEQIELLFEKEDTAEPVLFYASCRVILSEDGELFLSFDPAQPDTGDSLRDIALVFRERAKGPVAFVLECRHAVAPNDPFHSTAIVGAAKEAVAAAGGAIELLVSAHVIADGDGEDRTSPLTRALIEALDDPEAPYGLTLAQFFAAARESPEIVGAVPCFAHVRGLRVFDLLLHVDRPPPRAVSEPLLPRISELELERQAMTGGAPPSPAGRAKEPAAEPLPPADPPPPPEPPPRREPSPPPPRPTSRPPSPPPPTPPPPTPPPPPAPRAPYRSESISVDLSEPSPPSRDSGVVELPEQRSFLKAEPPPPPRVVITPRPEPPRRSEPPPGSGHDGASRSDPRPQRGSTERPPAEPDLTKRLTELHEQRSFRKAELPPPPPPLPRALITPLPEPPRGSEPPPSDLTKRLTGVPIKGVAPADHIALGDALKSSGDLEAALTSYKRALGVLAGAGPERAEIYLRLGEIKRAQDKRREAIAHFEKALALFPALDGATLPEAQRAAMEALIDLNVAEGDARGVAAAEEQLLGTLRDPEEQFRRLVEFGIRWQDDAGDPDRARAAFERARSLQPDDIGVVERLVRLYQLAGMKEEALVAGQRLAALTRDPRLRAERYFALGEHCIGELRREELGLSLFDLALESDPSLLDPLARMAKILADRQEWSQLEQAYRRMLDRVDQIPAGSVRTDVTFELCRRLGLLFRDHLEDPALGLDAFEDALQAKPADLPMLLSTAELARSLGKHDLAAVHLADAAAIDPRRTATYHDLFEASQKLRRPDQAYHAACVTTLLGEADARERFIFEEHKPEGVPKPTYPMPPEGWGWLRRHDRDLHVAQASAVLAAVTPAAIAARLAHLAEEGRLPELDPAMRQDPEQSTVSIVRSLSWASHLLGVPTPAIYLGDDPDLVLGAVVAEEPTVIAGTKALRGRSLPELAFLAGRHLVYHVGGYRLLLYYPSMEDLTACFLAAIRIVLPEVPAPRSLRAAVAELESGIASRISEPNRVDLAAAVAAFEASGSRVHLADWAGDLERCATRAGFLLSGDLEVAAAVLRAEPRAVLEPEEKVADLLAFAVSEEHHALREALGIAIQP